ncbi:RNA-binding transcriptional accessory protein, partial [Vibrio parahaemolyticus]|nr:RNA-binding transcriptional accessory protein [Vibrio parahaemolyticus]
LEDTIWNHPQTEPEIDSKKFFDSDNVIADTKAALDGAREIIMERIDEDEKLLEKISAHQNRKDEQGSRDVEGKEKEG